MKYTSAEFWEMFYEKPYEERDEFYEDWYKSFEVGDRANVLLYTDREPVTVIKRTATTITVRYDKAMRDDSFKLEWVPGGFSAICLNQDGQKWIIEEDPNGRTETFRWHKNEGKYMSNGCKLFPDWAKFYDYNF